MIHKSIGSLGRQRTCQSSRTKSGVVSRLPSNGGSGCNSLPLSVNSEKLSIARAIVIPVPAASGTISGICGVSGEASGETFGATWEESEDDGDTGDCARPQG